jgi:uncharacterized integral membrane protein
MSAASEKPGSSEPTTAASETTTAGSETTTAGSQTTTAGSPPRKERASRRDQARTLAWVLLAVIITVFAVLNTGEVTVDWIVGSGRAPLIIVIALSLLVGIILTYLADRRSGKRR